MSVATLNNNLPVGLGHSAEARMSNRNASVSRDAEGGRIKFSGESQGGSRLEEHSAGKGGAAAGNAAAEGMVDRCIEVRSSPQEAGGGGRLRGRLAALEAAKGGPGFEWDGGGRCDRPVALILFAGDDSAAVTLASELRERGWIAVCIDTEVGGEGHNLLVDAVVEEHLADIEAGVYDLVWLATPCESYTTRQFPPLRRWGDPWGLLAPAAKQQYLGEQNQLARFTAVAIGACPWFTLWVIENPADVTTKGTDWFWPGLIRRCFLWHMPPVQAMLRSLQAIILTFACCAFGAPWRKWTTVAGSRNWGSALEGLHQRRCVHKRDGHPQSLQGASAKAAAAYVPEQCVFFAEAASVRIRQLVAEKAAANEEFVEEAVSEGATREHGRRAAKEQGGGELQGAISWHERAVVLRERVTPRSASRKWSLNPEGGG